MSNKWFQVSVHSALMLFAVVAAYFAGRLPWERAASSSNTQAIASDRAREQASLYASVWREMALECRDDIQASGIEWSKQAMKRFGGGGSFVRPVNSEQIRPRAKRWTFSFSDEIETKLDDLKSLKAALICVWDHPPRVERWDTQSNRFHTIDGSQNIERWLMVAAPESLFTLFPDSIFSDEPQYVLLALPNDVEVLLAIEEHKALKLANRRLEDIQLTTFGIKGPGESIKFEVIDQVFKPVP